MWCVFHISYYGGGRNYQFENATQLMLSHCFIQIMSRIRIIFYYIMRKITAIMKIDPITNIMVNKINNPMMPLRISSLVGGWLA